MPASRWCSTRIPNRSYRRRVADEVVGPGTRRKGDRQTRSLRGDSGRRRARSVLTDAEPDVGGTCIAVRGRGRANGARHLEHAGRGTGREAGGGDGAAGIATREGITVQTAVARPGR